MSPNSVVSNANDHVVELRVPAELPYQLIFRMRRTVPFEVSARDDVEFHFASSLPKFLPLVRQLSPAVSRVELIKSFLRMGVGRGFYCIVGNGVILHRGWINIAFCRHYNVRAGEAVIGPIWSAPEARGRGLAKYATQCVINELLQRGLSVFYIDTSPDNLACLKMIENCGFGPAMGCIPREGD
ncbi:MAG: GNAT family N-acetyltransferase [Rhodanobacter sp.]